MATRPNVADLLSWTSRTSEVTDGDGSPEDECLQAALEDLESRCRIPDGALLPDAVNYPRVLRVAVLMDAARFLKWRDSPEGVAGFGDLGVVRILGRDSRTEMLIGSILRMDGFA